MSERKIENETTWNIKMLIDSMAVFAHEMNKEQTERVIEVVAEVATEIATAKQNSRKTGIQTQVTNNPDEMIERIRIKLACKEIAPIVKKMMQPR